MYRIYFLRLIIIKNCSIFRTNLIKKESDPKMQKNNSMHHIRLSKIHFLSLALVFPITLLSLLNFQCFKQSTSKQIDEKVFVQIYCDVVVSADLVDAKLREALVDSILNSYHTSREQFQNTVNAYSRDENKWEKVFTKVVAELERREQEIMAESDSTKIKADMKQTF